MKNIIRSAFIVFVVLFFMGCPSFKNNFFDNKVNINKIDFLSFSKILSLKNKKKICDNINRYFDILFESYNKDSNKFNAASIALLKYCNKLPIFFLNSYFKDFNKRIKKEGIEPYLSLYIDYGYRLAKSKSLSSKERFKSLMKNFKKYRKVSNFDSNKFVLIRDTENNSYRAYSENIGWGVANLLFSDFGIAYSKGASFNINDFTYVLSYVVACKNLNNYPDLDASIYTLIQTRFDAMNYDICDIILKGVLDGTLNENSGELSGLNGSLNSFSNSGGLVNFSDCYNISPTDPNQSTYNFVRDVEDYYSCMKSFEAENKPPLWSLWGDDFLNEGEYYRNLGNKRSEIYKNEKAIDRSGKEYTGVAGYINEESGLTRIFLDNEGTFFQETHWSANGNNLIGIVEDHYILTLDGAILDKHYERFIDTQNNSIVESQTNYDLDNNNFVTNTTITDENGNERNLKTEVTYEENNGVWKEITKTYENGKLIDVKEKEVNRTNARPGSNAPYHPCDFIMTSGEEKSASEVIIEGLKLLIQTSPDEWIDPLNILNDCYKGNYSYQTNCTTILFCYDEHLGANCECNKFAEIGSNQNPCQVINCGEGIPCDPKTGLCIFETGNNINYLPGFGSPIGPRPAPFIELNNVIKFSSN